VAVGLLLYVQEFSQSNQSLAGQGTRNPNTCSSREYNNCYDNDNGKNIMSQGSSLTTYFECNNNGNEDHWTYTDYCADSSSVQEYFCDGDVPKKIKMPCPPLYSCKNGGCTPPQEESIPVTPETCSYQETCSDDDAKDYFTKGRVTLTFRGSDCAQEKEYHPDECNSGKLKEYYCKKSSSSSPTDITLSSELKTCEAGCNSNGFCNKCQVQKTCSETDTGRDKYSKGRVTSTTKDQYCQTNAANITDDQCLDGNTLKEHFCQDTSAGKTNAAMYFVCENGCSNGACHNYVCTGTTPSNSALCSGDDAGLTSSISKTTVSTCTSTKKCEYKCNSGYTLSGSACVSSSSTASTSSCTSGWSCKDNLQLGYKKTDCTWINLQTCQYGCSGGQCNTGLSPSWPGWKCVDSMTKGHQRNDGTWFSVQYCPQGCIYGSCRITAATSTASATCEEGWKCYDSNHKTFINGAQCAESLTPVYCPQGCFNGGFGAQCLS